MSFGLDDLYIHVYNHIEYMKNIRNHYWTYSSAQYFFLREAGAGTAPASTNGFSSTPASHFRSSVLAPSLTKNSNVYIISLKMLARAAA